MAHEFTMPKLGLTMTDGTIREWLVADGTKVNTGDALLVIETDKVETEVEAREAGVLSISGVVGENYECGAVIGQLLGDGEAAPRAAAPLVEQAPAPAAATQAAAAPASEVVPVAAAASMVAEDVATRGERDRILASPMARAAARNAGLELAHIAGTGPGGRIVAEDVAWFADSRVPALVTAASAISAIAPEALPANAGVAATGGGRMLAELLGIDLRLVPASAGVRVTREDVAAYVRALLAVNQAPVAAAPAVESPEGRPEVPLLQEPSTMVPLRGMRGLIAERMHSSLTEMAQLTLSVDADMTAVNTERARLKQAGEPVPGYTAWVIAAASRALVDHPYANSQVTAEGVAYLPQINLGVAVSLDGGLIVPVIEQADTCSAYDLHTSVADLAGRAREGKLTLNELEGGTFSVTALGMYGVDMFTPVINPPNSAILGVGRLRTETRWEDGVTSPMTIMTLSLTWDHRAFDGAPAAEFAQSIVQYLEDPAELNA